MRGMSRVLGTVSNFIQFFPLSVFAGYAFRYGIPTNARWIAAFELAAAAALLQLVILLPQRRPTNRLILGANLYLLAGGAAALARQWWLLETYGALKESGIFLFMLGVGVVTTFATPSGFVAAEGASRPEIRRASLWLLGATAAAVVVALAFQGNRTWAAVVPVIALAVLQRMLRSRVQSHATVGGEASPPSAPLVRRSVSVAVVMVVGGLVSRALVGMATTGADNPRVYDDAGVVGADYSGLPAPRMLSARDGTPLAARVYEASRDVVVVAIHGSSGRGRYFHLLATYLSGRGAATVYAIDLRGHGESGGRRGDVDYIGQLEDDLGDVLTAIRRERPAARIVLLGHSAGGALALRYAGKAAGPSVDGYILLAPYLGRDAPTTKVNAGGWARPDVPKIRELSEKAARGDVSGQDAIVVRFNQGAESADPLQVLAYSFRMMASLSPHQDLARDLGALRRPLLVLAGARDESFFADRYEPIIAPYVKGTFTVLPDVSHLGVVVHPRTAEEVAGWLGRLP